VAVGVIKTLYPHVTRAEDSNVVVPHNAGSSSPTPASVALKESP
jgi:hypothetical protein